MENFNLVKFDQTIESLKEIVAITSEIKVDDLNDPTQIEIVSENRKKLRKVEIEIERQGKSMRDEANKYSKDVIAREKDLKAITSPEIERLENIEQQAKDIVVREARLKDLPSQKEKPTSICFFNCNYRYNK